MSQKVERFIAQNISLPISLREEIAKEARIRGVSISELIRFAITKEIQAKQSMREDGNAGT